MPACAPKLEISNDEGGALRAMDELLKTVLKVEEQKALDHKALEENIELTRQHLLQQTGTIPGFNEHPSRFHQAMELCMMDRGVAIFQRVLEHCIKAGLEKIEADEAWDEGETCKNVEVEWERLTAKATMLGR